VSIQMRWVRFNLVGLLGFVVQLGLLALFSHGLRWNYLVATAVAVEGALLQNFFWHERYTWADRTRRARDPKSVSGRLLAFQLGNGAVSLVGNMVLMAWLVGRLEMPALPANLLSVTVCSLVNFVIGDRMVFRPDLTSAAPEQTAALAGLATAYCADAADSVPRRPTVGHPNKIALGERKKQHGGGSGKGKTESDGGPDQQRRESPNLVQYGQRRKHAPELRSCPAKIEGDASQPI
jgi:putative flippase GtrA